MLSSKSLRRLSSRKPVRVTARIVAPGKSCEISAVSSVSELRRSSLFVFVFSRSLATLSVPGPFFHTIQVNECLKITVERGVPFIQRFISISNANAPDARRPGRRDRRKVYAATCRSLFSEFALNLRPGLLSSRFASLRFLVSRDYLSHVSLYRSTRFSISPTFQASLSMHRIFIISPIVASRRTNLFNELIVQ